MKANNRYNVKFIDRLTINEPHNVTPIAATTESQTSPRREKTAGRTAWVE